MTQNKGVVDNKVLNICSVSTNAFDVIIPSDAERWLRFGTIFAAYFRYSVVVLKNPYNNMFIFVSS